LAAFFLFLPTGFLPFRINLGRDGTGHIAFFRGDIFFELSLQLAGARSPFPPYSEHPQFFGNPPWIPAAALLLGDGYGRASPFGLSMRPCYSRNAVIVSWPPALRSEPGRRPRPFLLPPRPFPPKDNLDQLPQRPSAVFLPFSWRIGCFSSSRGLFPFAAEHIFPSLRESRLSNLVYPRGFSRTTEFLTLQIPSRVLPIQYFPVLVPSEVMWTLPQCPLMAPWIPSPPHLRSEKLPPYGISKFFQDGYPSFPSFHKSSGLNRNPMAFPFVTTPSADSRTSSPPTPKRFASPLTPLPPNFQFVHLFLRHPMSSPLQFFKEDLSRRGITYSSSRVSL